MTLILVIKIYFVAFFPHQIYKRVKSLEQLATIVKELSVEKRSETRMENTNMTISYIATTSFNKKGNNDLS